ncbi:hypothetical protein XF_2719 [Xylella fastidiosa 9a5c]|uniref:Uncharacterized protein n=1 Tax=Xylella fastidiosa (strain 9a5c) TaxID=160492 RepID=Q9PA01_XYLFA|nr:hypothetical protein XF_2719 [Xylella fastidiosa 9a5c]
MLQCCRTVFGFSVVDHDVNHNALIPDGAAF